MPEGPSVAQTRDRGPQLTGESGLLQRRDGNRSKTVLTDAGAV
jgi:hypothetical protein